jgi:DNA-binding beta-propeller fold protein YncE
MATDRGPITTHGSSCSRRSYLGSCDFRALKAAACSTDPITLPLTGLNTPSGVAVDTRADVYVTDEGNNEVLKLPPR